MAASISSRCSLEKKGGAVGVAAGFFVGGERDDEIVVRNELLPLQSNQGFDERCVPILHVDGAAAVEPAILFGQLERVDRPILGPRLHHIQMPEEQDRAARVLAAVADHDVSLGRMIGRREEHHVSRGKARAQQPTLNGLRGFVEPNACVVLISTNPFNMSRASCWSAGGGRGGDGVAQTAVVTANPTPATHPRIEFSLFLQFSGSIAERRENPMRSVAKRVSGGP